MDLRKQQEMLSSVVASSLATSSGGLIYNSIVALRIQGADEVDDAVRPRGPETEADNDRASSGHH